MTGEELLEWALKNCRGQREWELLMITKLNEEKIKKLTSEQIEAIAFFLAIVKKTPFYQGFGPQISVKDMEEYFEKFKKINKEV